MIFILASQRVLWVILSIPKVCLPFLLEQMAGKGLRKSDFRISFRAHGW